jgi:hypothetical protein
VLATIAAAPGGNALETTLDGADILPQEAALHLPLRRVAAVVVGNALEFYDFLTFTFFAVQIGRCFFPANATKHGLL